MKIIKKDMKHNIVKLKPENPDDLWHLDEIINPGDFVSGTAFRSVKKEEYQKPEIRKIHVRIKTEKKDFQGTTLRIIGKIDKGPEDIGRGYQALNINPGDIIKIKKDWSKYDKKILEESKAKTRPVLLAVIEDGVMDFASLKKNIQYLGSVKKSLPPKSNQEFDSEIISFYKECAEVLKKRSQEFEKTIIGGHKLVIDRLKQYLKNGFIFVNVSSTGKTGLNEIIRRGYVEKVIHKDRLSKETKMVELLLEQISKNGKYAYGTEETKEAIQLGAVEILLITDKKVKDSKLRGNFQEINSLMKQTEQKGGKVMIIKSFETPGQKLDGLGGIGALLRYKIS